MHMLRHLFLGPWYVRRVLPASVLQAIEQAVRLSESTHDGEIRVVVEAALHPLHLFRRQTARQRAIELFSSLGIWDTEHNNGVLIYLLLAEHDVEIVADRGIHQLIGDSGWEPICQAMELAFHTGNFEAGLLDGIEQAGKALRRHFPAHQTDSTNAQRNELPDAVLVL